jgi:plasmid stabilization system protein ParE
LEFIKKDSPKYAQSQVEKIQNTAKNLENFPQIDRVLPEFPESNYKEILTGQYRII